MLPVAADSPPRKVFKALADQFNPVRLLEFARWGRQYHVDGTGAILTGRREGNRGWVEGTYMPARATHLKTPMREYGLYPYQDPPEPVLTTPATATTGATVTLNLSGSMPPGTGQTLAWVTGAPGGTLNFSTAPKSATAVTLSPLSPGTEVLAIIGRHALNAPSTILEYSALVRIIVPVP